MMVTRRSLAALFEPSDAASLAAFRVLFGLLMAALVLRFVAHGWVAEYFIQPKYFIPYYGFEWVRPWPGQGMYLHFAALGVCALLVAAGAFYRVSMLLFGLLFSYAHFIDKTHYLNHYYLISCLCFLLSFLPLGHVMAFDAWRKPELRRSSVPVWMLWALRAQFGLVYFFGGIAKLKSDWLIEAEPMKIWLAANADFPVVGRFFGEAWLAHAASYAGATFDLSIVPLLLWRRTRPFAFVAVVLFHLLTAALFQIGMFPWIMLLGSLLFLPPSWPRTVWAWRGWGKWRGSGSALAAALGERPQLHTDAPCVPARRYGVLGLLALYFGVQALLPLRHVLYPGNVCWSEQGFAFAWNVMLMQKDGSSDFRVTEPATGRRWHVSPTDYLTRYQAKMMASEPSMILAFAHIVAADFRARGVRDPEVRVDAFAALNGRRMSRLVDPAVDLAREHDGFLPKPWILPLVDAETQHGPRTAYEQGR